MGTKDSAAATEDPKAAEFAAAKAMFEEAKRKTAVQNGELEPAKPPEKKKPAKAEAAPEAEEPQKPAEPEAEKSEASEPLPLPKPKKKAPKPVAAPAPDPMAAVTAQLAALEAKITALASPKTAEPDDDEDDSPLDGIKAKLTERFGEDEAGALVEALEALHAPAAQRIAQLERVLDEARIHGRKNLARENRRRLSEEFPHLKKDDDAWEIVNGLVASSFEKNPKAYASLEEAYDAVAEKLYGSLRPVEADPADDEAPDDDEEVASRIAASSMTPPSKAPRKSPRSREDKMREHFEYLKKYPEDKAGARRLARELGIDR